MIKTEKQIKGLTKTEVATRMKEGKSNIIPKTPSRTIGQIIRANLFTSYNALNLVLATAVFIAGSPKNALFAGVIVVNTIIGIFQEIRAKKTLEKLSVINEKRIDIVRDGKCVNLSIEEIVLDDIIVLKTGEQILVDCEMIEDNEIEVDESLITGESDSILKKHGDNLLSGSFVTAGTCYAKVTSVGKNTYAAKLANEARKFKIINSQMQKSLNKIFRTIIWLIIPIGAILISTQLIYSKRSWQDAVIGSVSGIVGMVPQGLVLLTSTTFVVAIIRLAKWNTLIQELPATEVLARVDVLCLDKTGTITKGDLKLSEIVPFENYSIEQIDKILSGIVHNFKNGNQTQNALLQRYKVNPNYSVIKKIPFSSKRKWSGMEFEKLGAWILGAPEMILKDRYSEICEEVEKAASQGKRVLLLAKFNGETFDEELQGKIEKSALILIEDIIRDNAEETINYFNKQDVAIKIISGDNPVTVSSIASKVGIKNADKYIDARDLPHNEEEFKKVVENTFVFGRVSPHQKKKIVESLKKNGHTVAMTGDGVNDVLALKESDCGIAMAAGSDATKAVAQLVLLNSEFSALPHAVLEGRRLINNLEKVSELFLSKTVYFMILCVAFAALMIPFPIIPIQLTLIGALAIGTPSFFLALSPNTGIVKNNFLKRVLSFAVPNGISISLSTIIIFLLSYYKKIPLEQCRSLALFTFGILSLFVLFKVSRPLNLYRIIIVISMALMLILAFILPFTRQIFVIKQLPQTYILPLILLCFVSVINMIILPKVMKKFLNVK